MLVTVVDTPIFDKMWRNFWSEEEHGAFASYIAANPTDGDVIQNSGGLRKIRWKLEGRGKSGGVRVIYFNQLEDGKVYLLYMFSKNEHDNIKTETLRALAQAMRKMQ